MHERYASGLSDEAAEQSIKTLNANLASVIDLSLAVKQAHWTLAGSGFIGVHELLDSAGDNLRDILDKFAERIVITGGTPKGTSQAIVESTALNAYPTDIVDLQLHVKELVARYKSVAASLRKAIDTTSEAGDEDASDLFTEASRIVDKDAWFIGSNANIAK